MPHEQENVLWLHAERRITLVELSDECGLPQGVLRELVELGSLAPADPSETEWRFASTCVPCLRTAARLARDLELETPGLALALSFLQRIEALESEVRALQARLSRPPR